jgi:small subunit ribosomal protein S1
MKQIEEDPWHALPAKYPVGTRLDGKVRNLTSFGAFVEIEPGIDGLVHISDMSWTKRIQHPSEVVKKGDDVEVVILGVDAENKRISLGLKQTQDDPWDEIATQYHVGQELAGPITRLQDKGVAVDLGNDVEGFVPVSQIGVTGLQNPADVFAEGDMLDMRISEVDAANHRIVCEVVRVPKIEGGEPLFPIVALPAVREPAAEEGEGTHTSRHACTHFSARCSRSRSSLPRSAPSPPPSTRRTRWTCRRAPPTRRRSPRRFAPATPPLRSTAPSRAWCGSRSW